MDNGEIIKRLMELAEEHKEEIVAISKKYGPDAAEKLLEMFSGNSDTYYDAIEDMSVNELLDSASEDFAKARQNKEGYKKFITGLGEGLGLVLKIAIKSIIPIP